MHFPSSKLLVSTDYLTVIVSTHSTTTYAHFMSARAVRDFNVFTDNPRIKTYNGIPQKPGYHKPVKPSRALRRLLTAFRYEVKGAFHVDGIFADCKDRKKKTSAKQDYQDSDLGMQQSKCCALPLGDSPKLRERDHLLPDYFCETPYLYLKKIVTPVHGTLKNLVLSNALFHFSFPTHRLHTLLMP